MAADPFNWTDEAIKQLRALWAAGLSTAEIGRRLGINKNQVIGKAHRLGLSQRPSPVRPPALLSPKQRGRFRYLYREKDPETGRPAHSLWAIGDAFGCSEVWVQWTIKRLGLAKRDAPAVSQSRDKREGIAREPKPVRPPPLPKTAPQAVAPLPPEPPIPLEQFPPIEVPIAAPRPKPEPVALPDEPAQREAFLAALPATDPRSPLWKRPVPRRRGDDSGCMFPIGDPKKRGFRYCDADLADRTYCAEHCAVVYARSAA